MNNSSSSAARRPWALHALVWLMGCWIALTVAMAFVASANFRVLEPDTLRDAAEIYAEIPAAERRTHLRYAASELNRYLFTVYSDVHLVVAAAACALLLAAGLPRRRLRWLVPTLGVCLVFALIFALWFTPTMVELGREIDFMAREPEPPPVTRFFRLHAINVSMELGKLALLAAASVALVRR
ncbi:DUF4149 domain-containing protein [Haliangium sp.]|uniref:DUF4149 domain-containing protein n=1 Tax=Haliangium sp. TaxID=2663208 RepID=UPI003D14CDD7